MPRKLTSEEREFVDKNVKSLKSLTKGSEGVSKRKKEALNDDFFLFFGLGGSGIEALSTIRSEIYELIDPKEIDKKVRFLAIDPDHNNIATISNCEEGAYTGAEIYPLESNGNVRNYIDPNGSNGWNVSRKWANKNLYGHTDTSTDFAAKGAGARRQVGRTHLAYDRNYSGLRGVITNTIIGLITNAHNPTVRCFVFAGIAGGTGSGTVIDFGIILSDIIHNGGFPFSNSDIRAYLLLPSVNRKGNTTNGMANAYATLKELDHLNTLALQGDTYAIEYANGVGNNRISINDGKIFDFVSLIEGWAQGVLLEPGVAQVVLAKSVLSTIVKNSYDSDVEAGVFLLDSLLSNDPPIARRVTAGGWYQFPRNVNYTYNSMGYTECVVPVDLIVSYAMKKVFVKFYEKYDKGPRFKGYDKERKIKDLQDFLDETQLDGESVIAENISTDDVIERIDTWFGKTMVNPQKGPFYLVNFANYLGNDPDKVIQGIIDKYSAGGLFWRTPKKVRQTRCNRVYKLVKEYAKELNNKTFEVFTEVINAVSETVESNAEIITMTNRFQDKFSTSFVWTPISLCGIDPAVESQLEAFIGNQIIGDLDQLVDSLCLNLWEQRDKWMDLINIRNQNGDQQGAAGALREFVSGTIELAVKKNKSLLLVVAFSGNKDAQMRTPDETHVTDDVIKAAKEIYSRFKKEAKPLAAYENSIYENIASLRYIAIPDGVEWTDLALAIKDVADADTEWNDPNEKFRIYRAGIDDRICAFAVNHGVAPFMLQSVSEMEKEYEKDPGFIGLHLVQNEKGDNWNKLQNLIPLDRWDLELRGGKWYKNDKPIHDLALLGVSTREADIIRELYGKIDYLDSKGVFYYDDTEENYPYYAKLNTDKDIPVSDSVSNIIKMLEIDNSSNAGKDFTINDILTTYFSVLANNNDTYQCFTNEQIVFQKMLLNKPIDNPTPEDIKAYRWELSKQIIRRNDRIKRMVERTYDVIVELERHLIVHNTNAEKIRRFADRISMFPRLLGRRYLEFNSDSGENKWVLKLPEVPDTVVVDLKKAKDPFVDEHRLFFAYLWFLDLDPAVYDEICDMYLAPSIGDDLDEKKREAELNKQETAYWKNAMHPYVSAMLNRTKTSVLDPTLYFDETEPLADESETDGASMAKTTVMLKYYVQGSTFGDYIDKHPEKSIKIRRKWSNTNEGELAEEPIKLVANDIRAFYKNLNEEVSF